MRFNLTLLLVVVLALAPRQAPAQLVLVGNDEKVTWDDAGKPVFLPPGKDTVSVVDISNREAPRILVSLPLMNSVFGGRLTRSEEHTSELQSLAYLVCRLLLEKKKTT